MMIQKTALIFLVGIANLAFQAQSCSQPPTDDKIRMGPEARADIVYFFKNGVTHDEINEFQRTVMGIPNPNGTGYASLPGIMSEVMFYKAGLRGEALTFKPNVTTEQITFVKDRLKASPLIYRIYEDVVPDEIEDLHNSSVNDMGSNVRSGLIP
jgi:hypothetical protein